jgi:hypothetical protein
MMVASRIAWLATLAGALMLSAAASAQYSPDATLDLGIGYGQMALGQAALSGTRSIGRTSEKASRNARRPQAKPKPPAPVRGSLTFRSTPAVTRTVNQRFIEWQAKKHPNLRAQLAEGINSGELQSYFAGVLRKYGYAANNLADVSSGYYLSLWKIIHGREPTAGQVAGVRRQTREAMAQDSALMQLSDAAKQEICETFALHTALALQGYEQLVRIGDKRTLANFRNGLQATLAPQGPNLATMMVSDEGFIEGG